jgi:hypothetical protein
MVAPDAARKAAVGAEEAWGNGETTPGSAVVREVASSRPDAAENPPTLKKSMRAKKPTLTDRDLCISNSLFQGLVQKHDGVFERVRVLIHDQSTSWPTRNGRGKCRKKRRTASVFAFFLHLRYTCVSHPTGRTTKKAFSPDDNETSPMK